LRVENGPFDIFSRFRLYIGLAKVEDLPLNEQLLYPDMDYVTNGSFLAEMVSCIMCLSVWIGGIFSIYLWSTSLISFSMIPIFTLAISALTILFENKGVFNGK